MKEKAECNKIIAVDFDGTLSFGQWPDVGPANEKLVRFLQSRQGLGDKLILGTETLNYTERTAEKSAAIIILMTGRCWFRIRKTGAASV